MNAEIKTRWVEALRSGEYAQTTGALQRPGEGFCCLGVLCDLAVKEGVIHELGVSPGGTVDYGSGDEDSCGGELPNPVIRWADTVYSNPIVVLDDGQKLSLAEMNDCGDTFQEIADVIEQRL